MKSILAVALLLSTTSRVDADAWINEFHYDNEGTDIGEFVEVAYTFGTNINGYKLEFYNGNGGSVYRTESLSGDDTASVALAVVGLPSDAIQNGSPDGIALIDDSNSVVEFLSYEGSMTASDGAAQGTESNDIGVSESGTTPSGYSLQRTGTGCSGQDFATWAAPQPETKGTINSGQSFSCEPAPPTVTPVISPTSAPTPSDSTSSSVKILTYNIKEGGTLDSGWKQIIKDENAEIIVFTEVGNWDDDNDALLNQYLNEFNVYFSDETPYAGSTVQGIGIPNSANAIMTRFPILQTTQLTDDVLSSDSAHDLMVWKLDVGNGKRVNVIGIHLKCCGGSTNDDRRNNTMKNLIAWIDDNIPMEEGIILMGDFNSVSPVDTDPTFLGYQSGFEPSSGSSLNDGPLRMLLDSSEVDASQVHNFTDAFREANPSCGSNGSCCADTLCDSRLSNSCPERGYSYVASSNNFDSRIDFIIKNQHVAVSGKATVGDVGGNTVCTTSDHLAVDVMVAFFDASGSSSSSGSSLPPHQIPVAQLLIVAAMFAVLL